MKFILTVTTGDHDTWERHTGIEAPDKDALVFAILEALEAQCGGYFQELEDRKRKQALTPEKRKLSSYGGPWEAIVEFNNQKFEVNTDFAEHDISTLDEFFEMHRAEYPV